VHNYSFPLFSRTLRCTSICRAHARASKSCRSPLPRNNAQARTREWLLHAFLGGADDTPPRAARYDIAIARTKAGGRLALCVAASSKTAAQQFRLNL